MGWIEKINSEQNIDQIAHDAIASIVQLYTDYSHFVFELLQNAEDCGASKIKFIMTDSCLKVFHDGIPFSYSNLNALCNIAHSDKLPSLNQIGQFGVGFKSVFSICETVEVHSNVGNYRRGPIYELQSFDLEIRDFYKPVPLQSKTPILPPFTTLFVIPFSVGAKYNGYKSIGALREGVSKKLCGLDSNTLLFLKNLKEIEYEIYMSGTKKDGKYRLSDVSPQGKKYKKVKAIKESEGRKTESYYMLYSRPVNIRGINKSVDIAFSLNSEGRFVPTSSDYVSVYFPTQVNSDLKFLIQGPFKTSPDRSNIPFDDEDNHQIVNEIASLLLESVKDLRNQKLITLDFLTLLPLDKNNPIDSNGDVIEDDLLEYEGAEPWRFRQLYSVIRYLMQYDNIIPTLSGEYCGISNGVIFRGKGIGSLLSDADLDCLLEPNWNEDYSFNDFDKDYLISNNLVGRNNFKRKIAGGYKKVSQELITESSKDYKILWDYLVSELHMMVFRPEDLDKKNIVSVLETKDDFWLSQFYSALDEVPSLFQRSQGRKLTLLHAPIIKTESGKFIKTCERETSGNRLLFKNLVFLPGKYHSPKVEYVSQDIYLKNRHFFEKTLDLTEPDEFDSFDASIRARYTKTNQNETLSVSNDDIISDTKMVLKYLKDASTREKMKQSLNSLSGFVVGKSIADNISRLCGLDFQDSTNNVFAPITDEGIDPFVFFNPIKDRLSKKNGVLDIEEYKYERYSYYALDIDFYKGYGIEEQELQTLLPIRRTIPINIKTDDDWYVFSGNTQAKDIKPFSHSFAIPYGPSIIQYLKSSNPQVQTEQRVISSLLFKILIHYKDVIHGKRYTGKTASVIRESTCEILKSIAESAVFFAKDGTKKKTNLISKTDLDTGLYGEPINDNSFYRALGMKESDQSKQFDKLQELVKLDEKTKEELLNRLLSEKFGPGYQVSNIFRLINSEKTKNNQETNQKENSDYQFPVSPIKNYQTLKDHAYKTYRDSKMVQYQKVSRRIRVTSDTASARLFLKSNYSSLGTEISFCQMCGEPILHSVATQLIPEPKKELKELYLNLCYECNYNYREIREDSETCKAFVRKIKTFDFDSDYSEPIKIPVDHYEISFTASHLAEIKELLILEEGQNKVNTPQNNKGNVTKPTNTNNPGNQSSNIDAKSTAPISFRTGDRVSHPLYGTGRITALSKSGNTIRTITVEFKSGYRFTVNPVNSNITKK